MKFRSVKLKNFRQFYGEQEIKFSTCPEKNITLIHAENGTGKTAFLNAILWCLFEMHTDNFKDSKNILNKVAKQQGNLNYSVSIEFQDDVGKIFLVQRSYGVNGKAFKIFEIIDDSHTPVNQPNSFINSVIPKDMAKYFFFQGEGIGKMSDSKGGTVVKTAVKQILGFTIAELALKDLTAIKKEYQTSFSNSDKSGQLSKIQNQIISLEEDITTDTSNYAQLGKAIEQYKEKLEKINNKIQNSDSDVVKEKHKSRIATESYLERERSSLNKAKNEKGGLINEFATTVFGFGLSKMALDFINEAEYKGSVPAPFNEQLVNDILTESMCICGAEINPGSEAFLRIQEMLKKAGDPNLENRVIKARSQLTSIKSQSLRAKRKFSDNISTISGSEQAIVKLTKTLDELNIEIEGAESLDDIKAIESERLTLNNKLLAAVKQSGSLASKIETDNKTLVLRQAELQRLGTFSSEMDKYKNLVEYCDKVMDVLKKTLSQSEADVELRIIEKVNKYLEMFVRQSYKAVLIKSTFEIRLVDKNKNFVAESDGQSLLLSLTFIAALIDLSRERKNAKGQILTPGAVAPFVVDAPFGDLDNKYKGHVAKAIPESVEQVIFLLSSSHWEGTVEDNIRKRVGMEYNMVLEETISSDGKLEDSISILGDKYETVRYSMPIDRTILEKVASYV